MVDKIDEILSKLSGKFASRVWVGKKYSLADLIEDLKELRAEAMKDVAKVYYRSTCPGCHYDFGEVIEVDTITACNECGPLIWPLCAELHRQMGWE